MLVEFPDIAATQHALPFCLVCGHGISSFTVLKYWLENEKQQVLGCCNVRESYWRALEQGYLVIERLANAQPHLPIAVMMREINCAPRNDLTYPSQREEWQIGSCIPLSAPSNSFIRRSAAPAPSIFYLDRGGSGSSVSDGLITSITSAQLQLVTLHCRTTAAN